MRSLLWYSSVAPVGALISEFVQTVTGLVAYITILRKLEALLTDKVL